jgi:hypothetical protein
MFLSTIPLPSAGSRKDMKQAAGREGSLLFDPADEIDILLRNVG